MKFTVYRNDNQPFQTADGETIAKREFASHDAAVEFISSLPDQAAVEAGDYSLDAPEEFTGGVAPKLFILWDHKDGGYPTRGEDGEIITDGILGRIGIDNVYLTTYGARPKGTVPYEKLEVGQRVSNVRFSLSGETGYYDVYRVA